tara:strand:- start:564 stop:728 length:165 start_codon:yes stop_codon:yes gene_type:complete
MTYRVIIRQLWSRKPKKRDVLNALFDQVRDKSIKFEIEKIEKWEEEYEWKNKKS